jgi:CAAX prenyl protease-like protein
VPRASYRDTAPPEPELRGFRAWLDDRPQLPYLIPFMAYVALMLPATFGEPWSTWWKEYHPFVYAGKSIVAAVLLILFWHHYTPIRWTKLPLGFVVGLFGTVLWIAVEYGSKFVHLHGAPDIKDLFIPDRDIAGHWQRVAYLIIRVAGPTLVVPIMEELFFRDFLMRAMVRGARFQDVPVGTFTWFSLIGTSLLFGVNHGVMWPAGVAYGLLMGILLIRTKSLGACIVAHGTTNFTLYLYVIYTGNWQFM